MIDPLSNKLFSILCFRDLAVHHQYRRSPKFITGFVAWHSVPLFETSNQSVDELLKLFFSNLISFHGQWAWSPLSVGLKILSLLLKSSVFVLSFHEKISFPNIIVRISFKFWFALWRDFFIFDCKMKNPTFSWHFLASFMLIPKMNQLLSLLYI